MPTWQKTEVCNLMVKINGKDEIKANATETWETLNGTYVSQITVDQRIDAPDAFDVQFMAVHEGKKTVFDWVKEGASIELGFGYGTPETVFKGEIVYVEVEYDAEEGSFATLRGYDHSHRLTRGFSANAWGDGIKETEKISDLVTKVIKDSKAEKGEKGDGLTADEVTDTVFKSRYVPKAMTTDYDFIKWAGSNLARATDSGIKDDKKISFRQLNAKSSPVATICYEKPEGSDPILQNIRTRFQLATYPVYAKVRVHGWNPKEKKAFVGEIEACSGNLDCSGNGKGWRSGWSATGEAHYKSGDAGAIYERVAEFCENLEEAKKIAQGIFDNFSLRYLTGEAEVVGCAKIVPGTVVEMKGFGDRVSGKVLVTEATHHLSARGEQPYVTTFRFCSNAGGPAK